TSATSRYIEQYGGSPGFRFKQGKAPDSPDVPVHRDNLNEKHKRGILKQRSTSFTLPKLSPPDYIVSRRSWRCRSLLHESARQLQDAPDLVVHVRDAKGHWKSGQFSPAEPPNQWSTTIKRIRENVVLTITL